MSSIRYLPYVGKDFTTGGIFGKKILVLGESHYCSPEEDKSDLTQKVVSKYLTRSEGFEPWMNTFTKFERSLAGYETSEQDRQKIWDSVVFYNFLQEPMSGAREAGSSEQYANAAAPLLEVLQQYKPEYLIAWGERLWNKMPQSDQFKWQGENKISSGSAYTYPGTYTLPSGQQVKALCVTHPSAGYAWQDWYNVFKQWW